MNFNEPIFSVLVIPIIFIIFEFTFASFYSLGKTRKHDENANQTQPNSKPRIKKYILAHREIVNNQYIIFGMFIILAQFFLVLMIIFIHIVSDPDKHTRRLRFTYHILGANMLGFSTLAIAFVYLGNLGSI